MKLSGDTLLFNTYKLTGGLHVTNNEPIDDRILWQTIDDVSNITSQEAPSFYKGLVASTEDGKLYILTGNTPSDVSSWKDITSDVVFPDAKDIKLGVDIVYSGETIAPASSSVTDAIETVVDKMVENEKTAAAALTDLDETKLDISAWDEQRTAILSGLNKNTQEIEKNASAITNLYETKADVTALTRVYKIVSGQVVKIDENGYYTDPSLQPIKPSEGDVVNTISSITYDEKTYPVGTNFVCIKSLEGIGGVEWDPLAGIADLSIYSKLSAVTIDGEGVVTGGNLIDSGVTLQLNATTDVKVNSASTADELNGFRVESETNTNTSAPFEFLSNIKKEGNKVIYTKNEAIIGVDTITVSSNPGQVISLNGASTSNGKINFNVEVVDVINSASTSISATTAVSDTQGRNIADTFAMLDTYPTVATKPSVSLTATKTGIDSVYEVGTLMSAITSGGGTLTFAIRESTKGKFNSSYEGEVQPVYSYTNNSTLQINFSGTTKEQTFTDGSLPKTYEINDTNTFTNGESIGLGDNQVTSTYSYGYTAPSNKPHTKLGVETTKTGSTASEGSATWTANSAGFVTSSLNIRGAYAFFTNISQTGSTSEDDISYTGTTNPKLATAPDTKSLIDKKSITIKYPSTVNEAIKYYMFAVAPPYKDKFTMSKYNDVGHAYDGAVNFVEMGVKTYNNQEWVVYYIEALTETADCRFKITFNV